MFTPEQVEALLNMGDATEAEKAQARQQAFADRLRSSGMGISGGTGRMDAASQASRALQGVAGGVFANRAEAAGQANSAAKAALLRKLFASQGTMDPGDYEPHVGMGGQYGGQ